MAMEEDFGQQGKIARKKYTINPGIEYLRGIVYLREQRGIQAQCGDFTTTIPDAPRTRGSGLV
jgi:hypothetical protein